MQRKIANISTLNSKFLFLKKTKFRHFSGAKKPPFWGGFEVVKNYYAVVMLSI